MKAFFKSFQFALTGMATALREQRNLKIQFGVSLLVVALGYYFKVSVLEWVIILLCIGLVITLEMVNTALENLVNLVTSEWKPLAGKIKDISAGAVLFASFIATIIGTIIFAPYFFN
jgi:diacylglycerol kinase